MRKLLVAILLLCCSELSFSQIVDPLEYRDHVDPIPFEVFVSDKGVQVQMVFDKPFHPESRFSLAGVLEYFGNYKKEPTIGDEYMAQTYVKMNIGGGFSALAGTAINDNDGFRPTFGVEYAWIHKDIFFSVFPRLELWHTSNYEIIGMLEYTPDFSDKWGLYFYTEGLYNQNISFGDHSLSYIRFRAGARYRNFYFGFAASHTAYGPDKIGKDRFGVFVKTMLF